MSNEQRWAEAESIRRWNPVPVERPRARRRRRTLFGLSAGAFLVALVGSILAARSAGHAGANVRPLWLELVGVGCIGLSLVLLVWLLVAQFRSRSWSTWPPNNVLTRNQRKELRAQIRGQRAIDTDRLPLSRDLALHLIRQRGNIALYFALTLQWVGQTIETPDRFHMVALVAYVILGGLAVTVAVQRTRQAERFLATTASVTSEDAAWSRAPDAP